MDFMRNLLASIALAAPLAAGAHITAVNVERIEPFADGHAFGAAGPYERVTGKAKGELDPMDVHQRAIVNIAKAPRNARGMVEYEVDFDVLRPLDPARSNGTLLFEVTNRGRKFLLHWLLDAPAQAAGAVNDPRSLRDAGNGLFLERGYTIVWTGWEPEVARANGGMAITLPIATEGGQPIVRTIRDELVSGTRAPQVTAFRLAYEAATLDQSKAVLTVRRKASDTPRIIAANGWTYVDARSIKLLPDGTKPEPGSLYVLSYPAKDPKVLGIAFAATRDFVSFMRRPSATIDPQAKLARPGIQHAIAVGISQSGRYLRDHIASGFNHDEADRKVFDGVLAHISGIGRVFLDTEFGMSGRTNTQHEDHLYPENEFPFSTALATDPLSGKRGTLFRQDGFDPLLIEVNTSTEYWQKGASLLHTDARGE